MTTFLCSLLKLSALFPGILLAFLPMKSYLRLSRGRLIALTVPLTALVCVSGAALCAFSGMYFAAVLALSVIIEGVFYVCSLKITPWKSANVYLSICGTYSCVFSLAAPIVGAFAPEGTEKYELGKAVLTLSLCAVLTVCSWRPATRAARQLLNDATIAQTWYAFWILPILFVVLNILLIPKHPEILNFGRLREMLIVLDLSLLGLLVLFIFLFYLVASSINKNNRLQRENQLLSYQKARYDNLKITIDEIREARHNMRHHFNILQELAARGDWQSLKKYLCDARDELPETELGLCDNAAVDSVAGHYAAVYRKRDIPCKFELELPAELPASSTDICVVLSNLLENALEASLKIPPEKRRISVSMRLHSDKMVLISVENAFDGEILEKNGVIQSTKHSGDGIGLQSVSHLAERSGGYCRFIHENGVFRANVIIRGQGG